MALSDITPIKRSEEYLQRIADAIENGGGGGSDLPAVTAADNGDVLTVVNGAWDKAAPAPQLPAVTSSNNGNVLTVVDGVWNKAAPAGGISVVDFDAFEPRTETVDGQSYNSNANDLSIFYNGSRMTLEAGTYVFTDTSSIPELEIIKQFNSIAGLNMYVLPAAGTDITNTASQAGEGFYVDNAVPVKLRSADAQGQTMYAFIDSSAILAYGASH